MCALCTANITIINWLSFKNTAVRWSANFLQNLLNNPSMTDYKLVVVGGKFFIILPMKIHATLYNLSIARVLFE